MDEYGTIEHAVLEPGGLPMLRVHRALAVTSDYARLMDVDPAAAEEIAKMVINVLAESTTRTGRLCPLCGVAAIGNGLGGRCPVHGSLHGSTILIGFPPSVPAS